MSNQPQHTSLDDALKLITKDRERTHYNHSESNNYDKQYNNNNNNNNNNNKSHFSRQPSHTPSRPSPLKQRVDNNNANNINNTNNNKNITNKNITNKNITNKNNNQSLNVGDSAFKFGKQMDSTFSFEKTMASPSTYGKQLDNTSDTASVFKTLQQSNPSARHTGVGTSAFASYFDTSPKRTDGNTPYNSNSNSNNSGRERINNNNNPDFDAAIRGSPRHKSGNVSNKRSIPPVPLFGSNNVSGNNTGTNTGNHSNPTAPAFEFNNASGNNTGNHSKSTAPAFGFNNVSGNNTGTNTGNYSNSTAPAFEFNNASVNNTITNTGDHFNSTAPAFGFNNFPGNNTSTDTDNTSMDLDLDNTNTEFGSPVNGSPFKGSPFNGSPFNGSPDRSGTTNFNNNGTASVFGNYSGSSNTASDSQFNAPTRNNFSPFMTNTPFIDRPTGNNFSPFMTNTPFIDAPMDYMDDTTNPKTGSPFDTPPNHTLNNNNSPTNSSAYGATAFKGNSGTGFVNHSKSPGKPPPKFTPTASSDTTSGLQSTFGGSSKRTVNNNGVVFSSSMDFSKKKSVTHKLNDPPRRLPSFLNDDSDDTAPFNNSQRKKTSTKADRAARFGSTNKTATYDEMKQNRIEERRLAIENGTIPDPNAPTRLEDAIDFRGTCLTMCPEFEMVERDLQNGLDSLEMDDSGNVDPNKAVKTYRRSAAGNEQPLPCDVRPPHVLIKTLDYLMGTILTQQPLEKCHPFLRDRTRSIRQDFTLQNIRDESAVSVHERIARFHILCLHEMCELDEERFSEQQETEQLRKVLLSLMEFYEDLREEGLEMENEPEFRAYHLISHIRDPDAVNKLQTLPKHLFLHPYVQRALEFYGLIQRNNEIMETSSRRNKPENVQASQNFYTQFFKLVGDPGTPFLMACMLEWHFPSVRKGALKAMNAAHRHAGVEAEFLRQHLGYDTLDMVIEDAQVYGLLIDSTPAGPVIRFHRKNAATGRGLVFIEPLSTPKQRRSLLLVDPKKGDSSLRDIVNGTNNSIPATQSLSIPALASTGFPHAERHSLTMKPKDPRMINANSRTAPSNVAADYQQQQRETIQQQQQQQEQQQQQRLLAEQVKKRQEEIDIQLKAQREKIQQYEAAKREKQERERLERALKEQQLAEQIMAAEQALADERERLQREQERVEAEQQKARREARIKEIEIGRQRRAAIHSQVKRRLANQLAAAVAKETVRGAIRAMYRRHDLAKRYTKDWLSRARQSIQVRHLKRSERIQQHRFSTFFGSKGGGASTYRTPRLWNDSYTCSGATIDDVSHEKASLSLDLETSALVSHNSTHSSPRPAGLWDTIDYSDSIHAVVRSKWDGLRTRMEEDSAQPGWQLWISVADGALLSTKWLNTKFGLNNTFYRKVKHYEDCRITIRSIRNEDITNGKAVDELGAVLYSLSEMRHDDNDDMHTIQHWVEEKERLKAFATALKKYNPKVRAPFVFSYWPGTTSLKDMLIKIPKLLDLDNIDVISDFRILVMNPATITERLDQEVRWLSDNSIINQPLKTDNHAILKMRALVVAVERTTCHFNVGEVTIAEAIDLANRKIHAYNKHLVDVPFNWTPFVVPAIPEQPLGDRTATGADLFDLGCMWVHEVAKKRVIEPVRGGVENLGAVVEGILKLHMHELERRLKR